MALPELTATFAENANLPRKQMLAKWLVSELGSGSIAEYYSLPERYLWAKIAVAVGGTKTEADYISLPTRYVWSDIYNGITSEGGIYKDWSEREALGHIAAAYRGDTSDSGALATYINWPWRYQVASIIDELTEEPEPSFAPTDLPELELWLDAGEGVINTLGNYFTDETRGIELAGFPTSGGVDPNSASYYVNGVINGKNKYDSNPLSGGDFGGQGFVFWNGSAWQLDVEIYEEEGSYIVLNSTATGDTEYPWQATWPAGTTVNPVATTFDTPATNDETVTRWVNKVSGKPNLNQGTLASQPVFKSDVNGRKAVFFNGDALSGSGFSTFGQEYSYYLVATSLLGSSSSVVHPAIRLATSTTDSAQRGYFGANSTSLAVKNGSTLKASTLSRTVTDSSAVFSARFNLTVTGVVDFADIGRNLSFERTTRNSTVAAGTTVIRIGAGSVSGVTAPINSNFSEVLVYKASHDEATALQVINYLVQKWNIDTNL